MQVLVGFNKAQGTGLSVAYHPNDLWCADYKGEFQLDIAIPLRYVISVAVTC